MLKIKKILLFMCLIILPIISSSESAVAMGSKDSKVPVKKEGGTMKSDTSAYDLLSNIDELMSRRWPDLFDAGLASYAPRMNIQESADSYHIEAELPGVKKEDVQVVLKDDYLVISGEKRSIKEDEKDQYRRIERSHGSFYRTVSIPRDVDREKITAELADGVLKVDIMKSKEAPHSVKKILLK